MYYTNRLLEPKLTLLMYKSNTLREPQLTWMMYSWNGRLGEACWWCMALTRAPTGREQVQSGFGLTCRGKEKHNLDPTRPCSHWPPKAFYLQESKQLYVQLKSEVLTTFAIEIIVCNYYKSLQRLRWKQTHRCYFYFLDIYFIIKLIKEITYRHIINFYIIEQWGKL